MKKKVTKEEQTQMNAKEFKKALEYIVKENYMKGRTMLNDFESWTKERGM